MVSFASSIMKNIVVSAFPSQSRFPVKLICCISFESASSLDVYLSPLGMQRRSDISFRSHIDRDVADHAETSSRCRNGYISETDLFETSL